MSGWGWLGAKSWRACDRLRARLGAGLLTAAGMFFGAFAPGCGKGLGPAEPAVASIPSPGKADAPVRDASAQTITRKHHFGSVGLGSKCKHTFKIGNRSQIPWTLKMIHTGCGCVVTEMSNKTIAPGATETAAVVFNAGERGGKYQQDILVNFEEADAPLVRLQVSASVHREETAPQEEALI